MSILDFFMQRKTNLEELAAQRDKARRSKGRIRLKTHLSEVFDQRTVSPLFEDIRSADPLRFPGYAEKVEGLARRSGLSDAFSCAVGTIKGHLVVGAELIPEFLMGSMGTAVGEAICRSAEYARERKLPLVIFSASGGARMQEGMFSLMQMAKTSAAIRRLSDDGGLYISVLTHPTTGGVTASFAMLGDIILAEPKALIGFAGPRVIEQTIRSKLPEGFQSSEFQQDHGFVDKIVEREQLRDTLAELLDLHPYTHEVFSDEMVDAATQLDEISAAQAAVAAKVAAHQAAQAAASGAGATAASGGGATVGQATPEQLGRTAQAAQVVARAVAQGAAEAKVGVGANAGANDEGSNFVFSYPLEQATAAAVAVNLQITGPAQHVEIARNAKRPHARDFIDRLFDNFVELHGDRSFRDDHAIITGLATFAGTPVTLAAHLKGSDLQENIACNFGMPHPEGYRKFIRAAKQAEKFGRPVITFIDTPGAYPGAEAEERGQGEAVARCLYELSGLKVPTIAVITGEGGSGGALALGLCDRVLMYEYAIYSVLSPEGFASILWKDAKRASEASEVMKLTAADLHGFGMIDTIIKEPQGGAHLDANTAIEALRTHLAQALRELGKLSEQQLLDQRYAKYRKFS